MPKNWTPQNILDPDFGYVPELQRPGATMNNLDLLASFNSGVPSMTGSSSNQSPWGSLIGGGLSILNNWLMTRNQQQSFQSGTMVPAVGSVVTSGAGALLAAIRAAGGQIVGNVIRIGRAAYAGLPGWVKEGIVALGMTVLISDAMDGSGGLIRYGQGAGGRRRRGKGITATELRGFNKMSKLLKKVGMRPKALGGGARRKVCK